jgi:hypothetical protein
MRVVLRWKPLYRGLGAVKITQLSTPTKQAISYSLASLTERSRRAILQNPTDFADENLHRPQANLALA